MRSYDKVVILIIVVLLFIQFVLWYVKSYYPKIFFAVIDVS